MKKPFSQACENNKQPILEVISDYFKAGDRVLEIGSGTAQHALYFCQHLPELRWIPSEIPENMNTLTVCLEGAELPNLAAPETLDVTQAIWPAEELDALFSANCLHIMPAAFNSDFFRGAGEVLKVGAILCVYGPFKYKGDFTSDSNAGFDLWLKERNPLSGIRDFEIVNQLAADNGFALLEDRSMPANNQCLIWEKVA
jgi:cyclopropane fatty-acyl-phospholipid synthase-like methyltransferase